MVCVSWVFPVLLDGVEYLLHGTYRTLISVIIWAE
jgi:hypothetical protein